MWRAVSLRMRDIGSISTRSPSTQGRTWKSPAGVARRGGRRRCAPGSRAGRASAPLAAARGRDGGAVLRCSTARSTSSLVTRPWAPEPRTDARSTPSAAAIFRAIGVARTRSPSGAAVSLASASAGGAACRFVGAAAVAGAPFGGGGAAAAVFAGASAGAGAGADAAARDPAPSASITASTASTCTTAPSSARISWIVPAAGLGISASTLSVEISTMGWSFSTTSPMPTSQRVMVPSETDSPISGMTTSIIGSRTRFRCGGRGRRRRAPLPS